MIYPWQQAIWRRLMHQVEEKRLPHALLFIGPKGIGKHALAEAFVGTLLCQEKASTRQSRCGVCHSCRLQAKGVHPNILQIAPEESKVIKIEQIRDAIHFINQSSFENADRFVIMNQANLMNHYAANAFLKTIEEPADGAILILVCDQYGNLPKTLLSRCQRVLFPLPEAAQVLPWLSVQLAGKEKEEKLSNEQLLAITQGSPLMALQYCEEETLSFRQAIYHTLYTLKQDQTDLLSKASEWQKKEPLSVVDFVISWQVDLIRLQLGARSDQITNKDHVEPLQALNLMTTIKDNLSYLSFLNQLRQHLLLGMNLNKQLIMEEMLVRWVGKEGNKGLCF